MVLTLATSAQNNVIVTLHLLYVFQQACNRFVHTERESPFINTGSFRDFLRLNQEQFFSIEILTLQKQATSSLQYVTSIR
jgi:hypothetical protein